MMFGRWGLNEKSIRSCQTRFVDTDFGNDDRASIKRYFHVPSRMDELSQPVKKVVEGKGTT